MSEQRNITVKISGREYSLVVRSEEEEEYYRLAADSVNKKIALYQQRFLGKPETDILSFVAFNVCVANVKNAKMLEKMNQEATGLHDEISKYLDDIEK
ncbi:MAG: cell division protein ZapA [Bacteroidales bacterium]|nr:cell division protein ZapA [Bacteroidales bacterium]